jgi:hypothetical protein
MKNLSNSSNNENVQIMKLFFDSWWQNEDKREKQIELLETIVYKTE